MKKDLPARPGKVPGKPLWKDEDKDRAVAVYKSTGNLTKTATLTGISLSTLKHWQKQNWWGEKVRQVRAEDTAELEQAFTEVAKKSQEVALERLKNGDFVLDKEGKMVRKPVSLRDATIAGGIAVQKRRELSEEPQREQELGTTERLIRLVEQFARITNAKQVERILDKEQEKINGIIDVTPIPQHSGEEPP